ncbi:MAG: SRPBCC domain-containing protein [Bacteroidota bacterium]|nr:SRPBCC domain-containing protein [Bacteroidota bacterium]
MTKIHISANILAEPKLVWEKYTNPTYITQWNFAHESWCCPSASNDLRVGGKYEARMEARDGSFGFDFWAIYDAVEPHTYLAYTMGDGRKAELFFKAQDNNSTLLEIHFDPETENSIELQKQGWQAILDNFKRFVEG